MAKTNTYFHGLNVGVQDKTALARVDLERMRLASEDQTNLMCKATGPAFMRPGFEYLASTDGNAKARIKEFVFGASDAALMEFTNLSLRVFVDDQLVTRSSVTSAVTNGDFSSATGWDTTGVAFGIATISGGKLSLNAFNVEAIAQCRQSVSTSTPNIEHALRIIVDRGPVLFRCGSTSGGDEYIAETSLRTGVHSLAFTPTGTYHVQFSSKQNVARIVDSIVVEAAGVMEIPTPWAIGDIPNLRVSQSADVCFVACDGIRQRRIERRSTRSWSVAEYNVDDGPFQTNANPTVRLKPEALSGNTTLNASAPYFKPSMVGRLFKLSHTGQKLQQTLTQEDTYTNAIRVNGIADDRIFHVDITGTWGGTVRLQRSYDAADTGFANAAASFTAPVAAYEGNDGQDNAIYWYRLGFGAGDYTSGAATISITYSGGGGAGICRVTGFISPTLVNIEVLTPFKNTVYTRDWQPGEWSDFDGYPSADALSDGRLWWFGQDRYWGSISDAFESFDEEVEGDSGPISRSIATGGVNATTWAMSLERLIAGTEGAVATIKSSSFDEPLTPTNLGVKEGSTVGSAPVDPVKVDGNGIFIERSGSAIMEATLVNGASNYTATQISKLTTDIFASGVCSIAVQRRPDTRIWLAMNDGSAACMVYEPEQEVLAFIPIETDGDFESFAVLPALVQDRVYASIKRNINGSDKRYIERMALDSEVKPATVCKTSDAAVAFLNSPASATVPGLSHLVGESVVAWADGEPLESEPGVPATFVVSGAGTITLPSAKSAGFVGLPYPNGARYKSARLAYGAAGGTAMLQKKAVDSIGFVMTDFTRRGIKVGPSFDALSPMPEIANGSVAPLIVLGEVHDEEPFPFGGSWDTDSRVCMQILSPYTGTACGLFLSVMTNER